MNDILFYKSFSFIKYKRKSSVHVDNTKGINCFYLGYLRKGNGRVVTSSGEVLKLCEGDVFLFPKGLKYHSYWLIADDENILESYRFTYLPCNDNKKYKLQKIFPNKEAMACLEKLGESRTVSLSGVSWLYMFFSIVEPDLKTEPRSNKDVLLEKIENYIISNTDFKVSELASHCCMSESALYAFFSKNTDTTPVGIKNRILAEKASELLKSTDFSIEEISYRLGINSIAHFRKIIREHTGKTPMKIRKEGFNI